MYVVAALRNGILYVPLTEFCPVVYELQMAQEKVSEYRTQTFVILFLIVETLFFLLQSQWELAESSVLKVGGQKVGIEIDILNIEGGVGEKQVIRHWKNWKGDVWV